MCALLCCARAPSVEQERQASDLGCEAGEADGAEAGEADGLACASADSNPPLFPAGEPESCDDIDLTEDAAFGDTCVELWIWAYRSCYEGSYDTAYDEAFASAGCPDE